MPARPGPAVGRPLPRAALVVALAMLSTLHTPAAAQELRVAGTLCLAAPASGTASPCDVGSLSLAATGVRLAGSTVGLELAYRAGPGSAAGSGAGSATGSATGGAAQLGLSLAANETFGPLGNVVFELDGDVRTDGRAQLSLGARGVLGPVAARLTIGAWGADAATFEATALASDARPSFGGNSAGLQLGLTGRLERNLILEAAPQLYLSADGLSARLSATLRRLRTFGENELRLQVTAGATPGFADGYGALGAGVTFPRGRAPDITVAVNLGLTGGRLSPGASVSLAENLAGGLRVALDAAVEPYRLDVHPGRATAYLGLPLGDGRLGVSVAGAFLDPTRPPAAAVETSLSWPVTLGGRR